MQVSEKTLRSLSRDASSAARLIKNSSDILIVSHIDADGISSAAIASETCRRLGKEHDILFAKKMDESTIAAVNSSKQSLVWIADLGSGYISEFTKDGLVITDHHVPDAKWKNGQTLLDNFRKVAHVNPHNYGVDGSLDACGSSMTYFVSKAIDPANTDLAFMAVVGSCGDLQDRQESCLTGLNRMVLDDAVSSGVVDIETDIRLFGRESRPLVQFLQYSSDPEIPGLSNDNVACSRFYSGLDISLKNGSKLRVWDDLSEDEKKRATDSILSLVSDTDRKRLYGEVYTLPKFSRESGLHDAKEFATALNSCGRYDDADTGLRMCFGDEDAVRDAMDNRAEHRRNISAALSYVKQNDLIRVRKYIQYFDAGTNVKETVVGIVAGMILGTEGFRKDLPMIAFADADDGVKVSARADRSLADRGLDLSVIMSVASKIVGGYGGGHNVAAGATIPKGKEKEFLDAVEDMVSSQII